MNPPRPTSPVSRRRFLAQMTAAGALALAPRWALAADTDAPKKKLGVVLVGLGSYAEGRLAPALQNTKHCRLVGVVTGDPAKGRKWASKYGFSKKNVYGYGTMDQMAANADIDVVYVVTPNSLHAEHCIAAAKAGKHVITEKPMATSVADCDAIIAACKAAGVRLMVGYRLHYEPHTAEMCRIARDQDFGPFMKITGENGFSIDPDARPQNMWRLDKKLAGGGPLMDMGVYVVQAVCMTKAEAAPIAVTAKFDPVTMPEVFTQVEQSLQWTMEFADGAVAHCRASYVNQWSSLRADAAGGWVELPYPAFYYDEPLLNTSRGPVIRPEVNHQEAQLDGMALEIRGNRPSLAPGEMGRRDIAITTAIYAAVQSGGRVKVQA